MPELIDKAKVLKYLTPRIKTETPYGEGYNKALEDSAALVALMPTIEAEPVRHGRWDEIQCFSEHGIEMASYECTSCGNDIERQRGLVPPYCEFCGARMDGGTDNG